MAQVIVELENRVAREVIDSYEDVTVSALESDPTVCLVEVAFTVAHGLNQICLSAHITDTFLQKAEPFGGKEMCPGTCSRSERYFG